MTQITCKNLTLGYEGKQILSGLNFEVRAGDYVCIIGDNGSGKTTLMRTILGLHSPMEGSINFADGLKKKDCGYLPQQSELQKDFPASVEEIVLSGFEGKKSFFPFYSKTEKLAALSNMERMGILNLKNRCYRELSGGQKQRVLLARALCATSKLLLLDEPVAGLDPTAAQDMYALISDLNKQDGITVIMITHDLAAADKYASHILHIGSDVFFATAKEYDAQRKRD